MWKKIADKFRDDPVPFCCGLVVAGLGAGVAADRFVNRFEMSTVRAEYLNERAVREQELEGRMKALHEGKDAESARAAEASVKAAEAGASLEGITKLLTAAQRDLELRLEELTSLRGSVSELTDAKLDLSQRMAACAEESSSRGAQIATLADANELLKTSSAALSTELAAVRKDLDETRRTLRGAEGDLGDIKRFKSWEGPRAPIFEACRQLASPPAKGWAYYGEYDGGEVRSRNFDLKKRKNGEIPDSSDEPGTGDSAIATNFINVLPDKPRKDVSFDLNPVEWFTKDPVGAVAPGQRVKIIDTASVPGGYRYIRYELDGQ